MLFRCAVFALISTAVGCETRHAHNVCADIEFRNGELAVLATCAAGAIQRGPLLFVDSYEFSGQTVYELVYDLTADSQKYLMPTVRCLGSVKEAKANHGIGDPSHLLLEPGAVEDVRESFDGWILFPGRVVSITDDGRGPVYCHRSQAPVESVAADPPATRDVPPEAAHGVWDAKHENVIALVFGRYSDYSPRPDQMAGLPEKVVIWNASSGRLRTHRLVAPTLSR